MTELLSANTRTSLENCGTQARMETKGTQARVETKGRPIMATSTQAKPLERRETYSLIGSDKVEGTPVCRSNGERVGQIERVMIDKLSGKVAYAVMSFGGFMGIGEDYYPLPWSLLTYNPKLEGYEVNIGEQQLKGAPKYSKHQSWDWTDAARGRKVYDYYG